MVKVIYDKHTANIILDSETLKAIPLMSGARHSHHSYSIYYWKS